MIKSHLNDLLREKAVAENRRLSLRKVAEETELSVNTIRRLKRGASGRVSFATLDRLCCYLGIGIDKLIEYKPDGATISKPDDPGM